jgi:hypothetical protein
MALQAHIEAQKKQGKIWIAVALLLVFMTYYFGWRKTIELFQEKQRISAETSAYQVWNQQQANNASTFKLQENGQVQMQLFHHISELSNQHHATIEEMSAPFTYVESGVVVNMYKIQLSSTFKSLLHIIYALETDFPQGRVVGYRFEKLRDVNSRQERLVLQLLVQSIGKELNV